MLNNLLVKAFDFRDIFSNINKWWVLYLILFLALFGLVVLFIFNKNKNKLNNLSNTKKLVYTAIFTSLSAIFNFITIYPVSYISISITVTICFLAGSLLGAKSGFIVGFLGDLIGAILFPAGAYNPLIGLASGLMGFIPGIIFESFNWHFVLKTILSFIITLVFCTIFLNTLGLYLMYAIGKKSFFAYLIVRLPWQVIVSFVNMGMSLGLYALSKLILPKSVFNFNEKK